MVPIHPNAFNAARPRWGASRAKSDPGDSFKLADYLRTDGHRLRRLEPLDAATAELQALCRLRDDHVEATISEPGDKIFTGDAEMLASGSVFVSRADATVRRRQNLARGTFAWYADEPEHELAWYELE